MILFYSQVFYNKILKRDSERVQDRFEQAKAQGVTVLEQRVPIEDIVQHINDAGTCIVLTNANLLSCETCSHFNLSGSGDNTCNTSCFLLRTCGSSAYQGHYVLAVGFDIPKRKIYYRNPTLRDRGMYFLVRYQSIKACIRVANLSILWMISPPWSIFKKSFKKCKFQKLNIIQYAL